MGGSFTAADGVPAYALAKWTRPLACVDRTPPSIAITAPLEGTLTLARPPLSATYSDVRSDVDPATLRWSLDGVDFAATCTTSLESADCTPTTDFADGAHQLRASIADSAGNRGTSTPISITVQGDPPPTIAIQAPLSGPVRQLRPQLIASYEDVGSGIDPSSLQWSLDGSTLNVTCSSQTDSGTCTLSQDFPQGPHVLRASIADVGGHRGSSAPVSITIDTQAPVVTITAPLNGAVITSSTKPLTFTWTDQGAGINLDGFGFFLSGTSSWRVFCHYNLTGGQCDPDPELAPADGRWTGTVSITDLAGNQGSARVVFTVETQPPTIEVLSPTQGAVTSDTTPEIKLRLTDPGSGVDLASLALAANGSPLVATCGTNAGLTTCVPTSPFAEGPVQLTADVRDLYGRQATPVTRSFTVSSDTTPPTILVTSPTSGSWTAASEATVQGSLSEAGTLTLNGVSVTVRPDRTFSAGPVALTEGSNALLLVAADAIGNPSQLTVTVRRDSTPPTVDIVAPAEGSTVDLAVTNLQLEWTDGASGVDTSTLAFRVNDAPVAHSCDFGTSTATCSLTGPPRGALTVVANLRDRAGNAATPSTVHFTSASGDFIPPVIRLISPPPSSLLRSPSQILRGRLSEAATLKLGTQELVVTPELTFSEPITLAEGVNPLHLSATDPAGNEGILDFSLTLDSQAPDALVPGAVSITESVPARFVATGTAGAVVNPQPGDVVVVRNRRQQASWTFAVDAAGSFSGQLNGLPGDVIELAVRDVAGNEGTAITRVLQGTMPTPVDPAAVAPAPDPSVPDDFCASNSFLWSGSQPVQFGVQAGTIDCARQVLVRGSVGDRNGNPLAGVRVAVAAYPELGLTLTRADGRYDLAVNGGAGVTLSFDKDGYLAAQRTDILPAHGWASFPDVVLVAQDPQATTVSLSPEAESQIARGSAVTDADGNRQATLIFPPGVAAQLRRPGGTVEPAPTLHVRATEYSVGPLGPSSLPAELPPLMAYTYAVELAADEASSIGAVAVEFDRPVPLYVEGFIAVPVGSSVPTAYFDRELRQWLASDNGRVVGILSESGGAAVLDVAGSGQPASAAELDALGVTSDELQALAQLYDAGQRLWRVPVRHFTPWAVGWPWFTPGLLPAVPLPRAGDAHELDKPTRSAFAGSIEVDNQILGQTLALTGTPVVLHYQSDRVPGRKAPYVLSIPLTDAELPADLLRVEVAVNIAGQQISQSFLPEPSRTFELGWDGLDRFARPVSGRTPWTASLTYVYRGGYRQADSGNPAWGVVGGVRIEDVPSRQESRYSRESQGKLGTMQALAAVGLGGWGLSVHHVLDVDQKALFYGDGRRRHLGESAQQPDVLSRVAGTGQRGSQGDGGDAKNASLNRPRGISFMRDGSLLVAEVGNCRIRRIDAAGTITTIAGSTCARRTDPIAEGIPATSARLAGPQKAVEAPDGSIYVADLARIWRIDPRGVIHVYAGTGEYGCEGIGGPARDAELGEVRDLAFDREGSLLAVNDVNAFWDFHPCKRVDKIDGAGTVTTLIPNLPEMCDAPGCKGQLRSPVGIATAADGSTYFTDAHYVSRRPPEGRRSGAQGWDSAGRHFNYQPNEDTFAGDGLPTSLHKARFFIPAHIAVGRDGAQYIADQWNGRVRTIGPDGIVNTIAGGGPYIPAGDEFPARSAALGWPFGVALDPKQESVYFSDELTHKIWRVGLPTIHGQNELFVPSEDGALLYIFDPTGRHLRTEDAITRKALWAFRYTTYPVSGGGETQLLTELEDAFGNITKVERAPDGTPQAIVAPFNQRTQLVANPTTHFLSQVSRVVGSETERVELTIDAQGLLRELKNPKGKIYRYTFDGEGRLTEVSDPEQGQLQISFAKTLVGHKVTLTTAEGRVSSTEVSFLPTGEVQQKVTSTDGNVVEVLRKRDGTLEQKAPDKSVVTVETGSDPRLGAGAKMVNSVLLKTENDRFHHFVEHQRQLSTAGGEPPGLTVQTDTTTVNGQAFVTTYTASTRTLESVTPEGRRSEVVFDAFGHPVEAREPGVAPVTATYDARGRLTEVKQVDGVEERKSSLTYDPTTGFLQKATDPLLQETRYERDAAGRVTKVILPDLREITYAYDLDGNLTELTPPSRPKHSFDHNDADQVKEYKAPAPEEGATPGVTRYAYDRDHHLKLVTRPSGEEVSVTYDNAGRLATMSSLLGSTSFTYDEETGKLSSIATSAGVTSGYTYDGPWLSELQVDGPFTASVQLKADHPEPGLPLTNFWLAELTINDQDATKIKLEYDDDGLATKIGKMDLFYDAASGRTLGSHVLQTGQRISRNGFGELSDLEEGYFSGVTGGTPPLVGEALLDISYERDELGRITRKTETSRSAPGAASETHTYDYTFDLESGRLLEVQRDGDSLETYGYDPNGNRTSWTTGFGSGVATYDAQDRLLTYGQLAFTYTQDGELSSKSQGAQTTTYTYDAFSNLRAVRLPDGIQIEYLVDGQNHRIGKKVNGTLVQRFLYFGGLSPIAELDASGNVATQYVYGGEAPSPATSSVAG